MPNEDRDLDGLAQQATMTMEPSPSLHIHTGLWNLHHVYMLPTVINFFQ